MHVRTDQIRMSLRAAPLKDPSGNAKEKRMPGEKVTLARPCGQKAALRSGCKAKIMAPGMIELYGGREMYKKLFVYAGPEHKHAAQKPEVLTF